MSLMLSARESFGEVFDTSEGGDFKPVPDPCLKDGKGVEIPITYLGRGDLRKAVGGLVGLYRPGLGFISGYE